MTGTTAEGRQAYALLSWANDDPSRRASEALDELGTLADRLVPGTPAFREVNNVGAVLARLEGAVSREPVRLAADTSIFAQFIELAWDPLKHPRDPHTGKFIGHGGAAASAVKASVKGHPVPSARAADRAIRAQMTARPKGSGPSADIGGIIGSITPTGNAPEDRTAMLEAHVKALQSQLEALTAKMDKASAAMEAEKETEKRDQKEEHRADLAIELGSVAMGVAISAFLGDATLSVAGLVPFVVKQALDRAPEIAKALSRFHVVGKGHGITWAAHPVRKPAQAAVAGMRAIKSSPKTASISQQAMAGMRAAARTLHRTPSGSS